MENENRGKLEQPSGQGKSITDKPATEGTGRSSGSTSTASSASTGSGTGRTTGTGRSDGTAEKSKKPVEVAIVVPPTAEEAKAAKPKATRKKAAKKKPEEFGKENISGLLQSVSLMVSSREGLSHWAINEKEADSIAEPLYNILSKSDVFSKVAEHSDGLALLAACSMVVVPRVMISVEQKKTKPKKQKQPVQFKEGGKPNGNKSGQTTNNRGTDVEPVADVRATFGEAIPSTAFQLV